MEGEEERGCICEASLLFFLLSSFPASAPFPCPTRLLFSFLPPLRACTHAPRSHRRRLALLNPRVLYHWQINMRCSRYSSLSS